MSPAATASSDYDFDTYRPCFLPEDEDFYPPPRSQLLPGPGEDIWKKFELLPTPPLSPSRTAPPTAVLSAAEHLEAVSELLDEDSAPFLHAFIIQDCMWSSSFAAATKLEKVVSERLACLHRGSAPSTSSGRQVNGEYLQDLQAAASSCVDPSAVFPTQQAAMKAEPELGPDSPPLSSRDSQSEEEEEEEEEGDEELDVVTVDQRTSLHSDSAPLVLKRSHISIHQHNYAAQRPAGKRLKPDETAAGRRGGRRSDGEDDNRRRTHNVLERRRRDELRASFQALREEVPAVASDDKAAKVAILRTAAELIRDMRAHETRLRAAKDELRRRSQALRRRLQRLRAPR